MQNDDINGAEGLTVCPSFSTYYSDRQAAAARAVNEVLSGSVRPQSELDEDEFGFAVGRFEKSECVDEDEFEFSILCDEVFPDGEIGQIFPIFDRDLVFNGGGTEAASVSLKKLFIDEEREDLDGNIPSSSSSEADELDSVEPGTYCVWKPKTPELSPGRCKKSKSTGSCSKRWKLRDLLLRRSNSDGKESFVFLTPSSSTSSSNSTSVTDEVKSGSAKVKTVRRASGEYKTAAVVSPHEKFYVQNRAVKEEDRRRSYLPYRKGLVGFGFFPNGMGVTNNFRPF
ncbi:unnamed protein product [Rhodiola kirilowii]